MAARLGLLPLWYPPLTTSLSPFIHPGRRKRRIRCMFHSAAMKSLVQVEGMEIGLSLGLQSDEGSLKVSLLECGFHVKNISIELEGGASWFYQGMVNAFKDQIGASVETTITKKLSEGVSDLDSFLQSLPKEIPVDDNAALNVTFTDNPKLRNSSITFEIDDLFTKRETNPTVESFFKNSLSSVICPGNSKMLGISLDEVVFNSAAALYYNAEFMQWVVDKIPSNLF